MRSTFSKSGGSLGESNSVAFMFDRVGEIYYPAEKIEDPETVMEAAIEAGAQDVESDADGHTVYCAFEDIGDVSAALENQLGEAERVKAVFKPQNLTPIDADKGESLMRLLNNLEDDDDVQNVYSNFEMSEEDLARLSS